MKITTTAVILAAAIISGNAMADAPITHPNMRETYQKCNEAIRHIDSAYEHNENHGAFGGHGAKAKELLQQAKREIELGDQYRNAHTHR